MRRVRAAACSDEGFRVQGLLGWILGDFVFSLFWVYKGPYIYIYIFFFSVFKGQPSSSVVRSTFLVLLLGDFLV